jgi:uncharacterized membrane protein YeaQ/YmgE (transglycosylase-associated protein family)
MRSCSRFWPPASIVPNAAADPGAKVVHATRSNESSTANRRRRTAHAFRLGGLAQPLTKCVAGISRRPHPARVTGDVAFPHTLEGMLLIGIILFGMLVGAAAQLIVGKQAKGVAWGSALAAGLVGSFIGGLIISLLSGDGLALRPSGIIGSLAGAIIVTIAWQWWLTRKRESRR